MLYFLFFIFKSIRILNTVNIEVFSRNGIKLGKNIENLINNIYNNINNNNTTINNTTNQNNNLINSKKIVKFHTVPSLQDISSSKVRVMVPNNFFIFFHLFNELKTSVHPEVYKYMEKNKLYGFKKISNNSIKSVLFQIFSIFLIIVTVNFVFKYSIYRI